MVGKDMNGDGSILDQVRRVRQLHEKHGEGLMADENVRALVLSYGAGIEETGAAMTREGIGAACSACARQHPSGCCFSDIESGYDDILLLLNLLLGCPLPEERKESGSCFFVGERGCRLVARYYFCLHYFCPELERSLGEGRIRALQQQVDQQLQTGWRAEEAVRSWLRARSTAKREDELP
ncbi:MAG: hypothetical protein MUC41_00320 [Syntrophobacteraceae bacterium]|jgi:hypothetical protein|nr:hypothetical protein [Syntrophobacteraceae bacterium]